MKLPKFPNLFRLKPRKKYHTTTATRRIVPAMDDYDAEPQTRLSSAFVVVLILHVVAVGGIYAFNSIKAHRKAQEPALPAPALIAKSIPPAASSGFKPEAREAVAAAPPSTSPGISPISGARIYHVKTGDSSTKVAAQFGVTVAELEEVNGAKNVATLRVGQILNIPKAKPVAAKKSEDAPKVAATAKATPKTYVVAKGDSPAGIARKLGVSQDELLKLNNIEDPKKLQIGQTLKVPAKKN